MGYKEWITLNSVKFYLHSSLHFLIALGIQFCSFVVSFFSMELFYALFSLILSFFLCFVTGFQSTGEMIVASPKYNVQETSVSIYEARMTLTIRKFQKEDIGSYRCIAKNSLGEVDSSIRLYGKLYHQFYHKMNSFR